MIATNSILIAYKTLVQDEKRQKDTRQIQVKTISLISSFILADKAFDPVCHCICHSQEATHNNQ